MTETTPQLPALRQDLRLLPGGTGPGGAPTWLLWDQPRNLFFQLGWAEFEMVSRWSHVAGPEALITKVNEETTLTLTPDRLVALVHFLTAQGLIQPSGHNLGKNRHPQSLSSKLLHHYLFFKIPLFRPDSFLQTLLPITTFLSSRFFLLSTGLAMLVGGYLTLRQWDAFTSSLDSFTTPIGLRNLLITLMVSKLIHELGHALAAKRLGCRIPTMGIAFLVLWPLFFTDTNETWRLPRKKDRFTVAMAGVAAESLLAAWALLAWALVDNGPWRGALFSLVAVVWTGTLLLNANPLMRFDGYFMLADGLDIPNLHERAFAMGKWFIRSKLLGAPLPPPETWTPKMKVFLIIFAFVTWVYRLFLYFGIALLVFHLFFKLLGVFLMAVEVSWFIFRPIVGEIGWWWHNRKEMAAGHVRLWMLLTLLTVVLVFLPWQSSIRMPAVLRSTIHAHLFPPEGGMIQSVAVRLGDPVQKGDTLLKLDSRELDWRLAQARMEARRFQDELLLFGPRFTANRLVAEQQLSSARTRLLGLTQQRERLEIQAPIKGTVTSLREGLALGLWVGRGDDLLEIRQFGSEQIIAYVEEKDRHHVVPGSKGVFYPNHSGFAVMDAEWLGADPFAVAQLEDLLLASAYGGPIEVERTDREMPRPVRAFFMVRFKPAKIDMTATETKQTIPGVVVLPGQPDTIAGKIWKNGVALWVRESGW